MYSNLEVLEILWPSLLPHPLTSPKVRFCTISIIHTELLFEKRKTIHFKMRNELTYYQSFQKCMPASVTVNSFYVWTFNLSKCFLLMFQKLVIQIFLALCRFAISDIKKKGKKQKTQHNQNAPEEKWTCRWSRRYDWKVDLQWLKKLLLCISTRLGKYLCIYLFIALNFNQSSL